MNEQLEMALMGLKVLVLARHSIPLNDPDWPKISKAIVEAEAQVQSLYDAIQPECESETE